MNFLKALRWITIAVVTAIIGFFAWFKQRDQDELDEEHERLARGLRRSPVDQSFAHDMEPVQKFRNGGAA